MHEELAGLRDFNGSVSWALWRDGIRVGKGNVPPEVFGGQPVTVRRIYATFREPLVYHAEAMGVPVELLISTIATESSGKVDSVRIEPGYVSDEETPHRVSVGLMQTLISTAREALGDNTIDRAFLLRPEGSIQAGTAYIDRQKKKTGFDPPKVAAAYNAGGVYHEDAPENRWKMRCYPLRTGKHVDRWIKWFNECFVMWKIFGDAPKGSFYAALNEPPT